MVSIDRNTAAYFHLFEIQYILQEVLNNIKHKSIAHNTFRIQDNDSIMWGFHCIAFIESMFSGKNLLDYDNLFFPNEYKKNDKKYI